MEVLSKEDTLAAIEKATAPLLKKIAELERLQDAWVDTREAMKIAGVSRSTLENLRKQNLIEFDYEGTKPLYSRLSLQNYRNGKGQSQAA